MSTATDKTYHYSVIRKTAYSANIIYLFARLLYVVLFLISKSYIMVYISAASILVYLSFFFVLKKKKYYLYALLCGNEYFAFIIAATLLTGFNTGFHFYLIGLCIVSFFTTYFSKNRDFRGTIVWAGLSLAIYLTLYFVTTYNAPHYVLDRWLVMSLFTLHAATVFVFIVAYLLVFIKYAFSLEKKIMNESRTDELTQISNRYGLFDYFELNDNKSSLYLALLDIDDFKHINDTYGHVNGDYILKRIAKLSIDTLKDSFVCRYGGEEFVFAVEAHNQEECYSKLEELRKNIEKEDFSNEKMKTKITATIGAVKYSKDMALDKWVSLADSKMYSGKNSGKNKVVI